NQLFSRSKKDSHIKSLVTTPRAAPSPRDSLALGANEWNQLKANLRCARHARRHCCLELRRDALGADLSFQKNYVSPKKKSKKLKRNQRNQAQQSTEKKTKERFVTAKDR
ncbi:hypothetical protein QEH56_24395, partial [Pelagicoccus enzymogenes]|uniref:hypothetical protein n=1 Tax=Pelagicoccus enzymogenes TaxID=2773457 RepID=UPI00280FCB18